MEALTFGRFQKRQPFVWASQYLVSGVEEGKGVQAEKEAQVGSMWTRSHALGRAVGSFQPGHLGMGAPPWVWWDTRRTLFCMPFISWIFQDR